MREIRLYQKLQEDENMLIYQCTSAYLIMYFEDLPTSKPHIYGLRSVYNLGSHLNLSCESGPSSPPPVLHWFLNGVKMTSRDEHLVTEMDPLYPLDDKRGIARSQLNLRLTEETLPRWKMENPLFFLIIIFFLTMQCLPPATLDL